MNIMTPEDWKARRTENNRGRFVYHYTKADTLELIKQNGIRLSYYEESNDPFEFGDWDYSGGSSVQNNEPFALSNASALQAQAKKRVRFLCFTTDVRREVDKIQFERSVRYRGFSDPNMWSHYADRHQGVCLVFDRARLEKVVKSTLENRCHDFWCSEVSYGKDIWGLPTQNLDRSGNEEYANQFFLQHHEDLFLKKYSDWTHEREYRVVALLKSNEDIFLPIEQCAEAVVLGCRCERRDRFGSEYAKAFSEVKIIDWELFPKLHMNYYAK